MRSYLGAICLVDCPGARTSLRRDLALYRDVFPIEAGEVGIFARVPQRDCGLHVRGSRANQLLGRGSSPSLSCLEAKAELQGLEDGRLSTAILA